MFTSFDGHCCYSQESESGRLDTPFPRLCCCRIAAYSGMYDSSKLSSKCSHGVASSGVDDIFDTSSNLFRWINMREASWGRQTYLHIILCIESVKDWIVINSCDFNSGTLWFVHLENSARAVNFVTYSCRSLWKKTVIHITNSLSHNTCPGSPSPKVFQPLSLWATTTTTTATTLDPTLTNDFGTSQPTILKEALLIHQAGPFTLVHVILPGAWCTILNYFKLSYVYNISILRLCSYWTSIILIVYSYIY